MLIKLKRSWVVLVLGAQRQSGLLRSGLDFVLGCFGLGRRLRLLLAAFLFLEEKKKPGYLNVCSRWEPPPLIGWFAGAHLEERDPFALVEDEVLVDEGRFCGQTLVADADVVLQGILQTITVRRRKTRLDLQR